MSDRYYSAETLAKAARADTSTFGRSTFFRRKLKERRTKSLSKNVIDDVTFENACDMAFPAYERVTLRHPHFQRFKLFQNAFFFFQFCLYFIYLFFKFAVPVFFIICYDTFFFFAPRKLRFKFISFKNSTHLCHK